MKYLATILAIVCIVTLLTIYFVWPDKQIDAANVAATVNGYNLTKTSVTAEGERVGYHSAKDYATYLDSAITRELLIQEAQRQNLDKEESFRKTLKSFYEESLIKTLMDRQYSGPKIQVSEPEIDDYLAMFSHIVTFTRLPVVSPPPEIPSSEDGPQTAVLFDDLAEPMKFLLSRLKPGELATRFDSGSEQFAIRLDKITPASGLVTTKPERALVKRILEECKRQQQLSDWLSELRNKASIKINHG